MVFPILSLPPELRRPIYRYLLPYSLVESRENPDSRFVKEAEEGLVRWYKGICPSILYANRQLHEEACQILYHENTFTIYVRHPRHARLPMNESRADDDSFIHISWKHRLWPHPRNHKIPLAVARNHKFLSHICRVHINLPNMRDLYAADMYMRTTSYASHYGLSAWVEKLCAADGKLPEPEQERMDYINQIKHPIDEIAQVLQALPRIDDLVIILTTERYEVLFIEFVISGLLRLRHIKHAQLLSRPAECLGRDHTEMAMLRVEMMAPRLLSLEQQLESASGPKAYTHIAGLSPNALEMHEMLENMRNRMLLTRNLRSRFANSDVDLTIPLLTNIMAE